MRTDSQKSDMISEAAMSESQLCEDAALLQQDGDLQECEAAIKVLYGRLKHADRDQLSPSLLWGLCGIVRQEVGKWEAEGSVRLSLLSLRVVCRALDCLKYTFVNCPRNQLMVAESEELLSSLLSCLNWTFKTHRTPLIPIDTPPGPPDGCAGVVEGVEGCAAGGREGVERGVGEGMEGGAVVGIEGVERGVAGRIEGTERGCSEGMKREESGAAERLADGTDNCIDEWREGYHSLAFSCVTCLHNLIATNSMTRKILWPHFKAVLENMLAFEDEKVAHASAAIIHNCLMEQQLNKEFCVSPQGRQTLARLLTLYETETDYSCFVLLAIEGLLRAEGVLAGAWGGLSEVNQRLVVEVVEAKVDGGCGGGGGSSGDADVVRPNVLFLVAEFKSKADLILRTHTDWLDPGSAKVLARLGGFLCAVAACDTWRLTLQQDTSLLVTCVALLQCMSEIGKMGGNAFTPLGRLSDLSNKEEMTQAETHPAFGVKCDLIRLIASLVHRNTSNQDLVREMDGLLLILESSKFDARNPLIKEASIFALRNLLEGNTENQRRIKDLRMEGVAESPGLAEMGMEAVAEGGKVRLVQRKPSSPSSGSSPSSSSSPEL